MLNVEFGECCMERSKEIILIQLRLELKVVDAGLEMTLDSLVDWEDHR